MCLCMYVTGCFLLFGPYVFYGFTNSFLSKDGRFWRDFGAILAEMANIRYFLPKKNQGSVSSPVNIVFDLQIRFFEK